MLRSLVAWTAVAVWASSLCAAAPADPPPAEAHATDPRAALVKLLPAGSVGRHRPDLVDGLRLGTTGDAVSEDDPAAVGRPLGVGVEMVRCRQGTREVGDLQRLEIELVDGAQLPAGPE